MAGNHISNLDPFILGICSWRRFSYVAKDSLFKNKFLAFLFYQVGAFPIRRETSDFRAIREILRRLKNGCPVIVFPEGTRIQSKKIKRVQAGVGFIAIKSGVPVVPAYLEGSDHALPLGAKWFRRHPIKIRIGPPLYFQDPKTYPEIAANQIMDKILALSKN